MKKTTAQMLRELETALVDKSLSKNEFIRVQAIMFRKKGLSRHETAAMVGRSIHAIEDWMTAYHQNGVNGLRSNYPKQSSQAKLSQRQRKKVIKLLQGTPKEADIADDQSWAISMVMDLVERETGVIYQSKTSYYTLLSEAGLSYQKVSFEDKRKDQDRHDEFHKQFEAKVKGGHISMWW